MRPVVAAALVILSAACRGEAGAPTSVATISPASPEPSPETSPAEAPVNVQAKLGDAICSDGPATLYRLPPPVYSGTYNRSLVGFGEITKLHGAQCRRAEIVSRAPIFPSDAEGVVPNRAKLIQWSSLGTAPDLWVRVELGSRTGWVELDTEPVAFAPGQFAEGVLEALEVEVPEPLHPEGKPDLTFSEPQALSEVGDVCIPGAPVATNLYSLAIRNAGDGTAPPPITLSITRAGPGLREKVDENDWMRGLEPREEFPLVQWPGGTRFELDPQDRIAESHEGNNEVTLDPRPLLVCG